MNALELNQNPQAVNFSKRLLKAFTSSIIGSFGGCTSCLPFGLTTNLIIQDEDIFGIIILLVAISVGCFVSLLIAKRSMKISWRNTFRTMLFPYFFISLTGLTALYLHKTLTHETWNFLHTWIVFYFPFVLGSFPAFVLCGIVNLYAYYSKRKQLRC